MKKIVSIILAIACFFNVFALDIGLEQYNDFTYKKPVIICGEREAKENITTTFIYNEVDQYKLYCREGYITTIKLHPNEKFLFATAGDTTRWLLEIPPVETNQSVYIKPFQKGLTTNLVIRTDKREYQFYLVSTEQWHNPLVTFRYPQESMLVKRQIEEKKKKDEDNYTKIDVDNLYFDYDVSRQRYDFAPSQVYDDGKKTVLVMKEKLQETPIVYIIDDQSKDEFLVNFRFKDGRMIIDRLFNKAVVRMGKKYVKITRKEKYFNTDLNSSPKDNIDEALLSSSKRLED